MQDQSKRERPDAAPVETIRRRGRIDGRAAGSWVIDGNTPDETCARILGGIEEGDPEILDALPELRLGEWADDLWFAYSDAWYAGMVEQAEADCRARREGVR